MLNIDDKSSSYCENTFSGMPFVLLVLVANLKTGSYLLQKFNGNIDTFFSFLGVRKYRSCHPGLHRLGLCKTNGIKNLAKKCLTTFRKSQFKFCGFVRQGVGVFSYSKSNISLMLSAILFTLINVYG